MSVRNGTSWSVAGLVLAVAGSLFSLGYVSNAEHLSPGHGLVLAAILLAPIMISAAPVVLRSGRRTRDARTLAAIVYVPTLPFTYLVGGAIFLPSFVCTAVAALRR